MATKDDSDTKRLADFGNIHNAAAILKLDDVEGQELTITGFTMAKGDFGAYAMIYAFNEDKEDLTITTGATLILEALKDVKAQELFPVKATFKKRGKTWICD
jgi:hypothetical protein